MHYIRFLKPPSVKSSKDFHIIRFSAKISITTDLGESFASVDIPLVARILDGDDRVSFYSYEWKGGNRQLELSLLRKRQDLTWPCRLLMEARDEERRVDRLNDLLKPIRGENLQAGLILSVISEPLHDSALNSTSTRVQRLLGMSTGNPLSIWEETGESIARHIWDAGLVLSAYLESYISNTCHTYLPDLPVLQRQLSRPQLEVLELGCGCGIVGIAFSKCFPKANVLITDLPQAEEIAISNISALFTGSKSRASSNNVKYQNLDWEQPLPEALRNGDLDLVLVADCTYNPDVAPDLVKTLERIVNYNSGVLILLAMKVRHDSEMIFFDLMVEKKMKIVEKLMLPLPLLGQDAEEIQLYVFAEFSVGAT